MELIASECWMRIMAAATTAALRRGMGKKEGRKEEAEQRRWRKVREENEEERGETGRRRL